MLDSGIYSRHPKSIIGTPLFLSFCSCLVSLSLIFSLHAVAQPMPSSCTVYCPDGSTVSAPCDSDWNVCPTDSSSDNSPVYDTYDNGAEQRARNAELERQRQAEAARVERERLAEEKRQKDAEFIRNRDAAANTLKGSNSAAMTQLKGLSGSSDTGLKGLSDTTSGLKSNTQSSPPLRGNNVPNLVGTVPAVESRQSELKRLQAREQELNLNIERDMKAIQNLGFSRRAEDFAEWEKLAGEAKTDFENEVKDAITDAIVEKAQNKLLEGLPKLDKSRTDTWIAALQKTDPPPVEIIAALRRLGGMQGKEKMVEDAEFILENIDRIGELTGSDDGNAAVADISQDILCSMVPPPLDEQCSLLKTETKLTIAALYNNAARRVAVNEVNRLTEMTEEQLKALQKLNALMQKHTEDRKLIREQISKLQKPRI